MNKKQEINRRKQRKKNYIKKENNFDIEILKREVFQIQNGNNIRNIFRDDFSTKQEVNF